MSGLETDTIRHALSAAQQRGCVHVRLRSGDVSFTARLAPGSMAEADEAAGDEFALIELNGVADEVGVITSPVVGYFRETKTPLEVGRTVKAGEAVAEIVALGIANELAAPWSGELTEVLVKPGEAVDYGQPIARVKKA